MAIAIFQNMKKPYREMPLPNGDGHPHDFRPTPLVLALVCLFPVAAQAALTLPALQIDPGLLQPPAKSQAQPKAAPASSPAVEAVRAPQGAAAQAQPAESAAVAQPAASAGTIESTPLPAAQPQHPLSTAAAEPAADAGALQLKPNSKLTLTPPPGTRSVPIFIQALRIQGHQDLETEAIGEAELRQWGQVITADRLRYTKPDDELFAEGNVRIEQKGDVTTGPELKLILEKKEGYMKQPAFELTQQIPAGRGDAQMLLFEGENKYRLEDARYTTCQAGSDDWFIRAHDLEIDRTGQVGTARNATIEFMDVPILYTPWMNFSLSGDRKSGFLSPSFGSTGNSGTEFALPYYWNIAPNLDATITPRLMTKRGIQLKTSFRYLDPAYTGEANLEVLPNDQLADRSRQFLSLRHRHNLGGGWAGSLNLERASDDNYFRDLSTQISVTSQANLLREGILSYAGSGWNFSARSQSFQTLQDPLAPIISPYRRNQLMLNGAQTNSYGLNLALNSELVDFTHPSLVNGKRFTLYPSVSLPLTQIYGYVTPKIGLHATRYSYDNSTTLQPDISRTLPIISLDSGLYFDRDIDLLGTSLQQTLEPRLYYLRVPFREQSQIPLFDSGDIGFGIPQIFTENRFSGSDRISDANQVTLGVTSRLLDQTGIERLRGTLAQRYYLSLPQVTLPGSAPPTRKFSDVLVALGGRVTQALALDSLWQYDPDLNRSSNFALTGRYLPSPGKVISAGYRYTPTSPVTPVGIRQIDAAAQWPLTARWNGLARWNYSVLDSKVLESLAGVEYNAGCWAFRAVVHSFATATSDRTNSIFFQLELNGVSSIGSNPLDVLRRNIYGYTKTTGAPYENSLTEIR